jgi:DNA-binding CsgD family transcriptional regulator
MTTLQPARAATTRCPRCSSQLLHPNADGDLECLCGAVIYATPPLPTARPTPPTPPELSPRQQELLHWVAMGANNRLVALNLGISLPTLKAHLRAIRDRLGLGAARSELEAVARRLEGV